MHESSPFMSDASGQLVDKQSGVATPLHSVSQKQPIAATLNQKQPIAATLNQP